MSTYTEGHHHLEGWKGRVGGSARRLAHLLRLLPGKVVEHEAERRRVKALAHLRERGGGGGYARSVAGAERRGRST